MNSYDEITLILSTYSSGITGQVRVLYSVVISGKEPVKMKSGKHEMKRRKYDMKRWKYEMKRRNMK